MRIMRSMRLKLRNFFQWSVCVLAFLVMGTAHAAVMNHWDMVDLTNGDVAMPMPARLVPLPPEQTRINEGILDVTKAPYNADNSGTNDAHAAIQNAIDDAYLSNLTVFFPSGTYLCSGQFTCYQTNLYGSRTSRKFAHKLVGSTEGPRPVLKLMDHASLTWAPAARVSEPDAKLFIHFAWRGTVQGTFEEASERNYCSTFRGIDIDMGNNPSNSAIRMNSAQYSVIEDVHIYGDAFVYGVDGTSGGGGSTSNVKVTGGKIGLRTGRTGPSIAGLTLENQSETALEIGGLGATIVTGFSIKAPASPTASYRAVYARYTLTGDFRENNQNVMLVDGTIEVPGSTGTAAIYNYDQDVHLQNIYVKAANIIESGVRSAPSEILAGNSSSWRHVRRYAFRCGTDSAPMVIDGVSQGTADTDHEYYEPLLTVSAPPTHLISRHVWSDADFPSWEDTDRISITDFGAIPENDPGAAFDNAPAIQAALNSATTVGSTNFGKTVFIPRGIFNVSSPIMVPAGAKLIGVGHSFSQLDVSTSWAPTSATSVLTTADDPTAEVVLAFFAIVGNTAEDAGSGYPDTTAQRYIRHVTVQSGKTLWRNVQIDTRGTSGVNRQCTEPIVLITGNAGGRFYNMANDNNNFGAAELAPGHPQATFHKLAIINTTLPISIYQLNPEHLLQPTGQVWVENCQDIRIYSWKAEREARMLTATDVAHLQLFGTEGIYQVDASGYLVLNGQCEDVRIATVGHRKDTTYANDMLVDNATGYIIPDRPTFALYAKNAPQLQLHDGATISDPELFNGSTGADFGEVLSGGGSMVKTFTINNGGFADLTNLVVTIDGANSGDFVASALGSATVSPGGSTTFTITFSPSASGTRTATAHIASNDPGAAFDVSLVGEGIASGNVDPVFGSDPIVKGNATANSSYTGQTLAGSATDGNGDTLIYTKVSGDPAWLNVATNGTLSGTPSNDDIGLNSWTIQVSDGNGGNDTAILKVTVDSVGVVTNGALSMLDSAFVRGGLANADTAQTWTDALELKNASNEDFTRIAMIKVDASSIAGTITSATFTVYDTDTKVHSLYVYGVRDSASFQDWTGGGSGSATWNSVMTNGLFSPKVNLHTQGDANLVLLGSQALSGTNASDTAVTVSGKALADLLNNDTDGLVTMVVCTDVNSGIKVRPHTHVNAPTLDYVYSVPALSGYEGWLSDYLVWLGSETNKTDNKDGDSANNLAEYALGGNPTNNAVTGILPIAEMVTAGGSNYVEYIHVQRNDTDSLEYRVETTPNLVSGTWTNTIVQITGTNTAYGVEGFDAVTNRIPTDTEQQFIRLKVQ